MDRTKIKEIDVKSRAGQFQWPTLDLFLDSAVIIQDDKADHAQKILKCIHDTILKECSNGYSVGLPERKDSGMASPIPALITGSPK